MDIQHLEEIFYNPELSNEEKQEKLIDLHYMMLNSTSWSTRCLAQSEEMNFMLSYCQIVYMILPFFGEDEGRARMWMLADNPLLGENTPIDMIKNGRYEKLLNFVRSCLNENKRP